MAKPVVFVIGASGNIGVSTVTSLSEKYGGQLEIKAGVRNPDKADKLKALANVTVVKAEMGSPDLTGVLSGVTSLYIVVPGTEQRTELTNRTVDAAKSAGVKNLLVLSVATAEVKGTVFGDQFTAIESHVRSSGIAHTFLRLPVFIDNNWAHKDSIQGQGVFYGPQDHSKPYTPVAVADAGKAAAVILSNPSKHHSKTYNILSDRYSTSDLAAAFTAAVGKEVKYVQVTYDQAKQSFLGAGWPEWQVNGLLELYQSMDAGKPETNQESLSDFESITGEKPTSLKAWLGAVAGAFK